MHEVRGRAGEGADATEYPTSKAYEAKEASELSREAMLQVLRGTVVTLNMERHHVEEFTEPRMEWRRCAHSARSRDDVLGRRWKSIGAVNLTARPAADSGSVELGRPYCSRTLLPTAERLLSRESGYAEVVTDPCRRRLSEECWPEGADVTEFPTSKAPEAREASEVPREAVLQVLRCALAPLSVESHHAEVFTDPCTERACCAHSVRSRADDLGRRWNSFGAANLNARTEADSERMELGRLDTPRALLSVAERMLSMESDHAEVFTDPCTLPLSEKCRTEGASAVAPMSMESHHAEAFTDPRKERRRCAHSASSSDEDLGRAGNSTGAVNLAEGQAADSERVELGRLYSSRTLLPKAERVGWLLSRNWRRIFELVGEPRNGRTSQCEDRGAPMGSEVVNIQRVKPPVDGTSQGALGLDSEGKVRASRHTITSVKSPSWTPGPRGTISPLLGCEVRGGTGRPAATNGRKSKDERLLEGLDALLRSLRVDEPGEPKPSINEQPASRDQDQQSVLRGRKKQRRKEKRQETGLLNALERLVTRAKREPQGVLKRLEGFLQAAKRGQIGRPADADRSTKESKTKEEPAAKPGPKAQDRKTYAEAARKTSKDQERA